jgi:hypothetical protein
MPRLPNFTGAMFLESSSTLTTALRMYEQAGFVMQPAIRVGSHYQRADVYMIYAPMKHGAPVVDPVA